MVLQPYTDEQKAMICNAALREINRARKLMGMPALEAMPKGRVASASGCPVTKALEANSTGLQCASFYTEESAQLVRVAWPGRSKVDDEADKFCAKLPEAVRLFIRIFDHDGFPELVQQ